MADVIGARAFSRQHNASARHSMAVALAAGVRGAQGAVEAGEAAAAEEEVEEEAPLNSGLVFLRATEAAQRVAEAAQQQLGRLAAADGDQKALNAALRTQGVNWRGGGGIDVLEGAAAAAGRLRVELLPLQLVAVNVDLLGAARRGGAFRLARAYVVHAKAAQLRRSGLWHLRENWREALAVLAPAAPPAGHTIGNQTLSRLARLQLPEAAPRAATTAASAAEPAASGAAECGARDRRGAATPAPPTFPLCLGGCTSPSGRLLADAAVACQRCSCAACAACDAPATPHGSLSGARPAPEEERGSAAPAAAEPRDQRSSTDNTG